MVRETEGKQSHRRGKTKRNNGEQSGTTGNKWGEEGEGEEEGKEKEKKEKRGKPAAHTPLLKVGERRGSWQDAERAEGQMGVH